MRLDVRHDACGPVWGHSADNRWNAIKDPEERERARKANTDNFARNHFEVCASFRAPGRNAALAALGA